MPTAATAVEDSDSKLGQTHPHDFTKRRKYNARVFLAVPLSTTSKIGPYYFDVGFVAGKNAKAILSQIRLLDRNRLINHVETLDPNVFDLLLDAVVAITFSKKVPPRKSGSEPKGHL